MVGQYIGVNGVARKVGAQSVGVNGVARKVKGGWVGVNGVARNFTKPTVVRATGGSSNTMTSDIAGSWDAPWPAAYASGYIRFGNMRYDTGYGVYSDGYIISGTITNTNEQGKVVFGVSGEGTFRIQLDNAYLSVQGARFISATMVLTIGRGWFYAYIEVETSQGTVNLGDGDGTVNGFDYDITVYESDEE